MVPSLSIQLLVKIYADSHGEDLCIGDKSEYYSTEEKLEIHQTLMLTT